MLKQMRTLLLNQGRKSTNRYGVCKYRGEAGCRCALGMFITDEEYTPEMDRINNLKEIHEKFPDLHIWEMAPLAVWRRCMEVHDHASQYSFAFDINVGFDKLEKEFPEHVEKELTK